MLSYEVTIHLEDSALAPALERYMTTRHVAEVVATGCFREGRFERDEAGTYRARYTAERREDLDRYLADHAARLRADFLEHFPDGLRVSRAVWDEVV